MERMETKLFSKEDAFFIIDSNDLEDVQSKL